MATRTDIVDLALKAMLSATLAYLYTVFIIGAHEPASRALAALTAVSNALVGFYAYNMAGRRRRTENNT